MRIEWIVMGVVFFICLLLGMGWVIVHLKNVTRKQVIKMQEQEFLISHQTKIINRLMPENPCQMVIAGREIKCMRPSSYVYGDVPICERCAQELIDNGANPPPIKSKSL